MFARPSTLTHRRLICALALGVSATAQATPVAAGDKRPVEGLVEFNVAEAPVDVDHWVREETTQLWLFHEAEETRQAVLRDDLTRRTPAWIQASALAEEASLADAERAAERAERELQTLQWVIDEQRRQADAANRPRRDDDAMSSGDDGHWLRRLMPRHWIALLKANREWVAAGGTTLLLVLWGASMFARRPSSVEGPKGAEPAPPRPSARRRHRRHRRGSQDLQLQ